MPNPFSFFTSAFVKYLNCSLRSRGTRLSLALANCIILNQFKPSRIQGSENSPNSHSGVSNSSFTPHDQIRSALSSLLPSKVALAEEQTEQKSCCSTADPKDLVLTDRALEKITFEIQTYEVVLFMKGNARKPSCGFSRQALDILKALKITTIRTVNVLEDEELRNGLKVYSKYPNFPQLYVRGRFVGGLETIAQMFSDGSLEKLIRDG